MQGAPGAVRSLTRGWYAGGMLNSSAAASWLLLPPQNRSLSSSSSAPQLPCSWSAGAASGSSCCSWIWVVLCWWWTHIRDTSACTALKGGVRERRVKCKHQEERALPGGHLLRVVTCHHPRNMLFKAQAGHKPKADLPHLSAVRRSRGSRRAKAMQATINHLSAGR